jgi:hypothetical protein
MHIAQCIECLALIRITDEGKIIWPEVWKLPPDHQCELSEEDKEYYEELIGVRE